MCYEELKMQAKFIYAWEIGAWEATIKLVKKQMEQEAKVLSAMSALLQQLSIGLCAKPDSEWKDDQMQKWGWISNKWQQVDLDGRLSMNRWLLQHKLTTEEPVLLESGAIRPPAMTIYDLDGHITVLQNIAAYVTQRTSKLRIATTRDICRHILEST